MRLAILISGRGSNMATIARACRDGRIAAKVCVVLCDRASAAGIATAAGMGLETHVVERNASPDALSFERALSRYIDASGAELVILAGFMRILSASFVERYAGRMLNIHPALLPSYRGLHTHRRVLEAGDSEHGASVHFVTAELDGGPVVLQSRVRVEPNDTEALLAARVQATEHIIYPRVIDWYARGRLTWQNGQPWLDGAPLATPVVEDMNAR